MSSAGSSPTPSSRDGDLMTDLARTLDLVAATVPQFVTSEFSSESVAVAESDADSGSETTVSPKDCNYNN